MNGNGYTPLHAAILTSTIWQEDDRTRILWLTMLALKDRHHFVSGSIPGLAHVARIPIEDCRRALEKFKSPDPDSRTKDNDGRRIEDADGGWKILNGPKFTPIRDPDARKIQNLLSQRRKRRQPNVSQLSPDVSQGQPMSAQAEAEAEALRVYAHYPRKVAKPSALRAITRAIGNHGIEKVEAATKSFAKAWVAERDLQFCPYPSTWFHQERFLDDPSTWRPSSPQSNGQHPIEYRPATLSDLDN